MSLVLLTPTHYTDFELDSEGMYIYGLLGSVLKFGAIPGPPKYPI